MILRHGIVIPVQEQVAHDPSSRFPFPNCSDPGAWLGTVSRFAGNRTAGTEQVGLHDLVLSAQEIVHRAQESEHRLVFRRAWVLGVVSRLEHCLLRQGRLNRSDREVGHPVREHASKAAMKSIAMAMSIAVKMSIAIAMSISLVV